MISTAFARLPRTMFFETFLSFDSYSFTSGGQFTNLYIFLRALLAFKRAFDRRERSTRNTRMSADSHDEYVPAFIGKLHAMLRDGRSSPHIFWSKSGTGIVIPDIEKFSSLVLPV